MPSRSARLPSLNALRVFEAVARHGNLSAAARELHVTPAAVSHQLKALENDLGVTLLSRSNGQYVLSEAAQAALPMLRTGFDYIAEAARRLRTDAVHKLLTISVGPSFASTWLVRRLVRFDESFPDIDLRLLVTNDLANFTDDGVDVAIRFGKGRYAGLTSVPLFSEAFYPVASPALLAEGVPATAAELLGYPLLHVDWSQMGVSEALDWPRWLRLAGVAFHEPLPGPCFKYTSYTLQAAVAGKGIALASDTIASDEIRAGRLQRLSAVQLDSDYGYYLVYPDRHRDVPKVLVFQEWLLQEIERDADRHE